MKVGHFLHIQSKYLCLIGLLLNKWIALIVFRGLHFVVLVSNKEIWINNLFHKLKYMLRNRIEDKVRYQKFYIHIFY